MGIYNNFVIQKGATWEATVYWKDPSGNPINITGYSAKFQMSTSYGGTAEFELTSASGITLNGTQGRLDLVATATQTANLGGTYHYELELINGATVYRILEGELVVSNQVAT